MELRVLKYFLMVTREENITKAASLLHVTQPTLSRQLMQLEEELGTKLFQRSRHRMILTDDGMLLRRRAEEIISLAEKAKKDFLRKDEELAGAIAIGSGEYQASLVISELFTSFRKKYPLINVEIYSGNSDDIKEQIEKGISDLGLLLEPVDIEKYGFLRFPVKEEWGVLISEDSAMGKLEGIRPQDLVNMPLIMTRREMIRHELTNWFGEYADHIRVAAIGNLPYNLALLARAHMGAFITLKHHCSYDGLRFIPLSPKLETGTVLVWKKTDPLSPAVATFIEHAKNSV